MGFTAQEEREEQSGMVVIIKPSWVQNPGTVAIPWVLSPQCLSDFRVEEEMPGKCHPVLGYELP